MRAFRLCIPVAIAFLSLATERSEEPEEFLSFSRLIYHEDSLAVHSGPAKDKAIVTGWLPGNIPEGSKVT
jgi:hypothetical protein